MIRIPKPFLDSIRAAAEAAYPDECCGLLVGEGGDGGDWQVTATAPSPNVTDGDPRTSFLVDAQIQFDLMRALGDGPERIVGHYHSHPDGPARPSEHDLESVFYPDHVWVIVAVDQGRAAELAAHRYDEGAALFRPLPLVPDPR